MARPPMTRDPREHVHQPPTTDSPDRTIQGKSADQRNRFLLQLDDSLRPLIDAGEITLTAATALGRHLGVNRCAYATVEEDEDTFQLIGNYNDGVQSIVGRYTFRQFGKECLRLMRAGKPYVVTDSESAGYQAFSETYPDGSWPPCAMIESPHGTRPTDMPSP